MLSELGELEEKYSQLIHTLEAEEHLGEEEIESLREQIDAVYSKFDQVYSSVYFT
ncbi:hypothetical protein LCM23_13230 [Cytobacillus kochii]|uniref:hypothetical protein n=1 Tax=Cytobacillus kochii TaxID=859143 RepID=UPI001CD25B1F|nr:hypothetical protein [Cytobacillus kochii]MCA1027058.1 hypothetical protein [Cytobacillus kochii]